MTTLFRSGDYFGLALIVTLATAMWWDFPAAVQVALFLCALPVASGHYPLMELHVLEDVDDPFA